MARKQLKKDSIKSNKIFKKKTFPNYKGMGAQEFYKALATWANSYDKARMERYTKALAEVIIRELKFTGEIRVPYIGIFVAQHYKAYDYEYKDENGKIVKAHVAARDLPVFVPCDSLINDVNDKGITKEYKKRVKKGTTNWRDYSRELRHELWEAEEEAQNLQTDESIARMNKLHEKFKQALNYNSSVTGMKAMERFDEQNGMKKYEKKQKEIEPEDAEE